jgi:Secretion system C-terminal sorting domain
MSKQLVVLCIALLIAVGAAWATDIHLLTPTQVTKGPRANPVIDEWNGLYLSRTSDFEAEYYLGSGALGDTFCVHFQPLAPCSIYFAEQQWFSAGPYQTFIWRYSDEAAALYPNGRAPFRGQSPVSPLGDVVFGPFNNSTQGSGEWGEYLFTQNDFINEQPIWNANGDPFMVGFVKTVGSDPYPLADDIEARGFSYTWFGGPWMDAYDNPWGGYGSTTHVTDLMMRVGVSYPLEAVPPIIGAVNQLPNTPNAEKTCSVTCEITDNNGWSADDSAFLYVRINEGEPESYEMLDTDLDDIFEASFTLDSVIGDRIHYWIVAIDDQGLVSSTEDTQLFFQIMEMFEADMGADILIIDHNSNNRQMMRDSFQFSMGWFFQWWDASLNNGIDEYVLSSGDYNAVIVLGWAAETMRTRDYENTAYRPFLEAGGNMFFADQDYFFRNGEGEFPTFSTGDFAYDVFGIESAINDPVPADTVFYGEFGDVISGDFTDTPITILFEDQSSQNWTDSVEGVGGATDIFFGEDIGPVNGLRYENGWGGRTVFLGFALEYATDPSGQVMSDQFETLMTNVYDWFSDNQPQPGRLLMTPTNTTIPAGGGTLNYDLFFANDTPVTYPGVTFWTTVTLPNGELYGPLYQVEFTAFAGMTATFTNFAQDVPDYAPAGLYTHTAYAGMYPTPVLTDSYTFNKLAAGSQTVSSVDTWEARGEWTAGTADHEISSKPQQFELSAAFPNPFNPTTSWSVALPETAMLSVIVYNIAGQKVAELASGSFNAGEYSFTFDASELASGLYFVRATVPGQLDQTQKVMLVR